MGLFVFFFFLGGDNHVSFVFFFGGGFSNLKILGIGHGIVLRKGGTMG